MTELEQKIENIKAAFQKIGKSQVDIEAMENRIKSKPELLKWFDDLPLNCPKDALETRFQHLMNS
jgi:hypothetical protein